MQKFYRAIPASLLTRTRAMATVTVGGDGGSIWKDFKVVPDTPKEFTVKNQFDAKSNPSGMTTMEGWKCTMTLMIKKIIRLY